MAIKGRTCKNIPLHPKNHNAKPEAKWGKLQPKHKKQRPFKEVITHKLGSNYGPADELTLPMLAKRLLKTDTGDSSNSALTAEQN